MVMGVDWHRRFTAKLLLFVSCINVANVAISGANLFAGHDNALSLPFSSCPHRFPDSRKHVKHFVVSRSGLRSKSFCLILRGGGRSPRNGAVSATSAKTNGAGNIADRLKMKLEGIKRRRTILDKYANKWGSNGDASKQSAPKLQKRLRVAQQETESKDQEEVTQVQVNGTEGAASRSVDSMLNHLNRTGLCASSELDNRVKTFIISMKKGGDKEMLLRALQKFEEFLLRPKSKHKRVRNKSAVLTKLILDAQQQASTPNSNAQSAASIADGAEPASPRNLSWSSAYRWGVAVDESGTTATALCNSTYMESYATAVSEQVFRADRDHEVRLRVQRMSRMMFVGVMSKSKALGSAHNASEWWGRYNMTGLVWYTVSNGRVLNGAMRIPFSGRGFAAGDEITLRLLLTKGRVEFEVQGQPAGFSTDVQGRVRVAVQFKSEGDAVVLLHRRTISEPTVEAPLHDGENVTAVADETAATEPPDPRYKSPFGGRKLFVGGTKDLDSDVVEEHFKRFGSVATVGLMRKMDGKSRGFGFVTFEDRRDAKRAVDKGVTTYKHGSDFARMQISECSAPGRGDLELDLRTAEVLRDVDRRRGTVAENRRLQRAETLRPEEAKAAEQRVEKTKALALDCEMVGVGARGRDSVLAKVSVVNEKLQLAYSRLVLPTEEVTDYRSAITGIQAGDLTAEGGALPFEQVQKEVTALLRGRVLVGHALHNDFRVLQYRHPPGDVRDTAQYKVLREAGQRGQPSLKSLALRVLGVEMHQGAHSAAEDAATCMRIYARYKAGWERWVAAGQKVVRAKTKRSLMKRK